MDVTEDHSLLTSKQQKIKPAEVILGKTKLLTSLPKIELKEDANQKEQDLAWILGLFFRNGYTTKENEWNMLTVDVKSLTSSVLTSVDCDAQAGTGNEVLLWRGKSNTYVCKVIAAAPSVLAVP